MVVLINYNSPFFDRTAAEELFAANRDKLDDERGFGSYLTPWFFNVHADGEFVGCIFCYRLQDKDWVGGFAKRKKHQFCLEALNEVKVCFSEIYAETKQKTAEFILKKADFVKIEPNIWVYKNNFKE